MVEHVKASRSDSGGASSRDDAAAGGKGVIDDTLKENPKMGAAGLTAPIRGPYITVRTAADGDWEALRGILKRHHARTVFADIPFSERKFDRLVEKVKAPKVRQCVLVAEADGAVAGFTWFAAGEYAIGEGVRMTTVHIIAVDRDRMPPFRAAKVFAKLMKGVKLWARTRGAPRVLVHVTTGGDTRSADRLLRAAGVEVIGGAYLT